jgi:DNA-binding transcriptional LysR family regulator
VTSDRLSIRDFRVFVAILRSKSVTHAARLLAVPQPSVSRSLSALRRSFGDRLFVRTNEGMSPTPRAMALGESIDHMLRLFDSRTDTPSGFDPRTSKRTFRIAASEVGSVLVMREASTVLKAVAPDVSLTFVPLDLHALIRGLQSGEIDIAVGGFPDLYSGIKQQVLFRESYRCLLRPRHPILKRGFSLENFCEADHAIVSAMDTGHAHQTAERVLLNCIPAHRIRFKCYSFLAAAVLAEASDLIITVPARTALVFGDHLRLTAMTPPMDLPGFDVKQYWHERFDGDPANQWLRHELKTLLRPPSH